ncbi:hypothetical protein SAMN05446037_101011 [Anaerovirgula multivorans]|uniref:Acetyltransferase (GNAT) domain-containing protein n=1 Tax=Anaerovirgula multivorans TaxID=312168 RepID=A0A239EFQ5_9FIRM|nr:hypothetical protein [Anaerovirgula multivorans]SNS43486.1 hypothetical protein SAMN05446037_101011 [Anaerovirgula multivorans]
MREKQDLQIEYNVDLSTEELYLFLNHCYGKWGNINYLNWKYRLINGVKLDTIIIKSNQKPIAFRGVFTRNLKANDKSYNVSTVGDTSVSKEYRGLKLYRYLVDFADNVVSENNCQFLSSYNQMSSITFLKNKERGWQPFDFSVKMKIFSYNKVFNYYLDKVLENNKKLKNLTLKYINKIQLFIENEKINLSDKDDCLKLTTIKISKNAFESLINNRHKSIASLLILGIKLFLKREVKLKLHFNKLVKFK